jgi:hypothetical protein
MINTMKNNLTIFCFLALALLLSLGSCRKKKCYDPTNRDCENYDPCYGKTRINALFRVRPGDNGFKPDGEWCNLIPCDTFNASSVRFDMPLNNPENSTYTWQVGNEPTPRTGKAFEVDFSDYLNAGNWEKHIPVTLTIKTPLNGCMTNAEDTVITVNRKLFFTNKRISNIYPRTTLPKDSLIEIKYKGYLNSNPSNVFTFKITKVFQNYYNGYYIGGLAYFYVGLPFADSIMVPRSVSAKGCGNFKHSILLTDRFNNPEFSKLTHHLSRIDYIIESEKKRTIKMYFFNNFHPECTFIGEEI